MSKIIEHELPEIIYDNSNHIIKCVISNIPIKRSIRKEIYINGLLMNVSNINIKINTHLYVLL